MENGTRADAPPSIDSLVAAAIALPVQVVIATLRRVLVMVIAIRGFVEGVR
jgi:hypothetical protein